MRTEVEQNFSDFFESWVTQLEELVEHLLHAVHVHAATTNQDQDQDEAQVRSSVSKLTAHFKLYYTVKWAHAREDVLAFFSPAWLTPLESAYNWVTGWKPSMAFRLLLLMPNPHRMMSEEQSKKIEALRSRIKSEEERVDREMERQQMALADQQMVQLSRLETRRRNGEPALDLDALVDLAINALLLGLERTMKAADCVRLNTLKGILEVLTPFQCLHFLASISLIQIRLRQSGNRNPPCLSKIPPPLV